MKKVLLIIFIAFLFLSPKVFAKNGESGYFKVVNAGFPIKGRPLKIKDGRVLFGIQTIFDPKTDTYNKTKYYDEKLEYNLENGFGTLLNDGKVLFYSPFSKNSETKERQSELYNKSLYVKIYDPIKDELKIGAKNIEGRRLNNKVVLQNGRVLMIYGDYPNYYYESLAFIPSDIFIYNPNTDKFTSVENKSKLALCNPVLLKDGKVLFRENKEDRIVIYNPKDNSFFISKHKIGIKSIILDDGRIFSYNSEKNGSIYSYNAILYDPATDEVQVKEAWHNFEFFKLSDDRILVFASNPRDYNYAYFYNKEENEFQKIRRLKTHIWEEYNVLLKNDNAIRFGGRNSRTLSSSDEERTELFNPNAGKSYFVKNERGKKVPMYTRGYDNILLDDGRLFIKFLNDGRAAIYVPKGYKAD